MSARGRVVPEHTASRWGRNGDHIAEQFRELVAEAVEIRRELREFREEWPQAQGVT